MRIKTYIFFIGLLWLFFLLPNLFAQNRNTPLARLKETRQRLEFARDIQASTNDPRAENLLTDAEISLRRAGRQLRNRRLILARRLINQANQSINEALKILFKEPIKKRYQRLEKLMRKAEQIVPGSGNLEAKNTLRRGLRNRELAKEAFRKNNFQKALFHYNKAYFLIQKSIDLVRNSDKPAGQQVEDEAYRFNQFYSKNEPLIANSPLETVRKNKRLAMELTQKAEAARKEGDFRLAIDYYHQAMRLLLRALTIAQGKAEKPALRAYDEVNQLDELIKNLEQKYQPENLNEQLTILYSRVKQLQEDAHTALDNSNFDEALQNAQLARDLIERMLKKSRQTNIRQPDKFDQNINRLERRLKEINQLVIENNNKEAKILLDYAKTAKEKAVRFFNNKKHRTAFEVLRMAEKFANSANDLVRFAPANNLTSETVSQNLEHFKRQFLLIQSKSNNHSQPDVKFCLEQVQKMLNLAQENYEKGFLHVTDACLRLGKHYLDKCDSLLR